MTTKILKLLILLLLSAVSIQAQNLKSKQSPETIQQEKSGAKVFVILDITVNDSIMYEQYRINVEPIIKKYGGKYLVRSGGMLFDNDPESKVIPVEGSWNPDRLIILEWDSIEQLKKFTKSDEYLKIVGLRTNSASTKSIIVKEYMKN